MAGSLPHVHFLFIKDERWWMFFGLFPLFVTVFVSFITVSQTFLWSSCLFSLQMKFICNLQLENWECQCSSLKLLYILYVMCMNNFHCFFLILKSVRSLGYWALWSIKYHIRKAVLSSCSSRVRKVNHRVMKFGKWLLFIEGKGIAFTVTLVKLELTKSS